MLNLAELYRSIGALPRNSVGGIRSCVLRSLAFLGVLILAGLPMKTQAEDAVPARLLAVDGLSDVLSLDLYPEGEKIHALLVGRFAGHPQPLVAYLASSDGGKQWNPPVFVNHDDDGPVVSKRGNDAQLAASGSQIVAAWQERGEFPGGGPLRLAYSSDLGRTWSRSELPVAEHADNQSYPDLAVDGAGTFHLVWLDDREENGNTQGLRYANSADGGRSWARQKTIDGAVCTCCWNRLGILPDQSVAVLYRDDNPHDMRLATRSTSGIWKNLGAVGRFDWHFSGCPHCGGGIASLMHKLNRTVHSVVWTGVEKSPGLYYLRSRNLGKTWSQPMRLGDGNSREADIAALSPARLAVVFGVAKDGAVLISARQSRDGGRTWSTTQSLSSPTTTADHPRILATPFGLRAFWTERRPDGGRNLAMRSIDS